MVDGPNVYVYLNNNPINLLDPWGLCGEETSSNDYIDVVKGFIGSGAVNILQEVLKRAKLGHLGKLGGRFFGPVVSTIQGLIEVRQTIRDPNLARIEKGAIIPVQVVGTAASIVAGGYGFTKGIILGAAITKSSKGAMAGGIIGGTFLGGGTAFVGGYIVDKLKTCFYNN